jgi:hypothetical protein
MTNPRVNAQNPFLPLTVSTSATCSIAMLSGRSHPPAFVPLFAALLHDGKPSKLRQRAEYVAAAVALPLPRADRRSGKDCVVGTGDAHPHQATESWAEKGAFPAHVGCCLHHRQTETHHIGTSATVRSLPTPAHHLAAGAVYPTLDRDDRMPAQDQPEPGENRCPVRTAPVMIGFLRGGRRSLTGRLKHSHANLDTGCRIDSRHKQTNHVSAAQRLETTRCRCRLFPLKRPQHHNSW